MIVLRVFYTVVFCAAGIINIFGTAPQWTTVTWPLVAAIWMNMYFSKRDRK